MKLSAQAQAVFDVYQKRSEDELVLQQKMQPGTEAVDRDQLLLPIGEEVAELLHTLIVSKRATRILELGTSYGYSTLVLADAARLTGGKVITLELEEYKQQHARQELARAGLDNYVQWECGDALEILPQIEQGIDIVLLDLWKELYIPCLDLFYPKLAHGAAIVADNMLIPAFHQGNANAYQQHVRGLPDILNSQLLDIGCGIELSCCWRP